MSWMCWHKKKLATTEIGRGYAREYRRRATTLLLSFTVSFHNTRSVAQALGCTTNPLAHRHSFPSQTRAPTITGLDVTEVRTIFVVMVRSGKAYQARRSARLEGGGRASCGTVVVGGQHRYVLASAVLVEVDLVALMIKNFNQWTFDSITNVLCI